MQSQRACAEAGSKAIRPLAGFSLVFSSNANIARMSKTRELLRSTRRHELSFACVCALTIAACAAQPGTERIVELRQQLRTAMQTSVTTRAQRDDQSRLLADVVEHDALDGMMRPEVQAAFGPGIACRIEVCRKNGFEEGDWYYEVGVRGGREVKQLPLVLFKFDSHDRTTRVFTLTTH
jgi:hypothetical protein